MRGRAISAVRCARSPTPIPTPSSAAIRSWTRTRSPTPISSSARAIPKNSAPRWPRGRKCWRDCTRSASASPAIRTDKGELMMAEHPELSAEERAGKAFPVSWDQFHRDCRALTWRLNEVGPFHAVIAITLGGLVPAAIVARELGVRIIDTVCIASYDHTKQGDLKVLKSISKDTAALGGGTGKGLLIVDDLVDTGKTGRLVREMIPDAHFATVYAKPKGRPLVDTFITEVSQDTWIFFPWDTALSFQPPIREGAA